MAKRRQLGVLLSSREISNVKKDLKRVKSLRVLIMPAPHMREYEKAECGIS